MLWLADLGTNATTNVFTIGKANFGPVGITNESAHACAHCMALLFPDYISPDLLRGVHEHNVDDDCHNNYIEHDNQDSDIFTN